MFIVLSMLGAFGGFLVFGNVFATTTEGLGELGPAADSFNVGAAFWGAVGMAVVWLPVIALFDYLRRDSA